MLEKCGELGKAEQELLGYLQDKRSGWRTIGAYALAAKTHLSKQTLEEIDRLKGSDPRPWVRLGAWQAFDLLPEKKENK